MDRVAAALRRGLKHLEELQDSPFFTYTPTYADGTLAVDENGDPLGPVNIYCVENTITQSIEIEIGGNPVIVTKRLFVDGRQFLRAGDRVTEIETMNFAADSRHPPLPGTTIRFPGPDGPQYRVLQVLDAPGLGHVVIDLADPHSNRS